MEEALVFSAFSVREYGCSNDVADCKPLAAVLKTEGPRFCSKFNSTDFARRREKIMMGCMDTARAHWASRARVRMQFILCTAL